MDDVTFSTRLETGEKVYISPVHDETYAEFIESDNLGGPQGYFLSREHKGVFEILAKVSSLEAAHVLFQMLARR
jgi:hypothetical protein